MLTYLGRNGLNPSDGELAALVVAFDIAWRRTGGEPAFGQDERFLRDRVAKAVADLVLSSGMRNPERIAAAALERIARFTC
jgi:hypothetical protein